MQLWIIFVASGVDTGLRLYVRSRRLDAERTVALQALPSVVLRPAYRASDFGLIFAFLTYSGFEASAVLSEETHGRPPRHRPDRHCRRRHHHRPTSSSRLRRGHLVRTGQAAASDWITDSTPLFTMGAKYGGTWLVDVLSIAAVVDAIAVSVAHLRHLHPHAVRAGRDGILPPVSRALTEPTRRRTRRSTLAAGLGIVYIVLTWTFWTTRRPTGLRPRSSASLSVAAPAVSAHPHLPDPVSRRFHARWNGNWVARIIFPLIGVVLTAFAVYASSRSRSRRHPAKYMPYTMGGFIVLGIIVGLLARARRVPAMLSVDAQVKPIAEPIVHVGDLTR